MKLHATRCNCFCGNMYDASSGEGIEPEQKSDSHTGMLGEILADVEVGL